MRLLHDCYFAPGDTNGFTRPERENIAGRAASTLDRLSHEPGLSQRALFQSFDSGAPKGPHCPLQVQTVWPREAVLVRES